MEIHIHVHQMSGLVDQLKDVQAKDDGKIPFRKAGEKVPLTPKDLRIEALAEALRKFQEELELYEEAEGKTSDFRWDNASGTGDINTFITDQAKAEGY